MATTGKIPTTADIYLEINGVKVAVVQSYKVVSQRSSRAVSAFGQSEPVATIRGMTAYTIELSRLYATDEAIRDGIDFYSLEDFNLVICRPDSRVIYAGCQWSELSESAEVGGMVLEKVKISAGRRTQVAA